ncbi:MAG TPA: DUF4157 domain-containing protein, partial [Ktedonobacteraceae bacterium]|nr:DUF4157 domain-containing protein [Ktedonobacteraceae bacterium]
MKPIHQTRHQKHTPLASSPSHALQTQRHPLETPLPEPRTSVPAQQNCTHLNWSLANIPISRPDHPSSALSTNIRVLPDQLRASAERQSGLSLQDVRVHYRSSSPAQIDALAYTRDNAIYLAPGQEQHLAHETWHVVQQKQGRVRPTLQARGLLINDETALEREADTFGVQAQRRPHPSSSPLNAPSAGNSRHMARQSQPGVSPSGIIQGKWRIGPDKILSKNATQAEIITALQSLGVTKLYSGALEKVLRLVRDDQTYDNNVILQEFQDTPTIENTFLARVRASVNEILTDIQHLLTSLPPESVKIAVEPIIRKFLPQRQGVFIKDQPTLQNFGSYINTLINVLDQIKIVAVDQVGSGAANAETRAAPQGFPGYLHPEKTKIGPSEITVARTAQVLLKPTETAPTGPTTMGKQLRSSITAKPKEKGAFAFGSKLPPSAPKKNQAVLP